MNVKEKPKRKRGRPRKVKTTETGESPNKSTKKSKSKTTEKGGNNEKEHKGDKRGDTGPTKKKRGRPTKDKQKTSGESNEAVEFSREKPSESNGSETEEKQNERQITEFKIDEEKSRKKCNKNTKSNNPVRKGVRVMKKENYEEAKRYLLLKKYKSKTKEEETRYEYMLNKIEKAIVV